MLFAGAILAAAISAPAGHATEFRSVADNAAILYDAPSAQGKKLFVVGRGYPLELVVTTADWVKVRDANGQLSWVALKSLSDKRTVMVKVKLAEIRSAPADSAPLVFQAEQGVLLDLNEVTADGWARVTHADGQSGYARVAQFWGA
jgi:SH3-like domain-containing protein